jgi:hypothetical protein
MRKAVPLFGTDDGDPSAHGALPRPAGRQLQRGSSATSQLFFEPLLTLFFPLTFPQLNTSFVNGYSGILLGLVMLDVPANQDIVTEALAGHRDAKDKLVEAMEEFATLHEQSESAVDGDVEMEHEDGEVEGEVKRGASDVAERIRKMLGRIQGSG